MRILAIALVAGSLAYASAAMAAGPDGDCSASASLQDAGAMCHHSQTEAQQILTADNDHVYTVEPQCEIGGSALCHEQAPCFVDGVEGLLYTLLQDGDPYGTTCLTDAEAEELAVVTPAMVQRAMRRLSWPQSPLIVQPPNGRTLVNFATNFHTDNVAPTTQTVTLLGQRVTIKATPAEYHWHFGDRAEQATTSAGAAYPDLEITHTYLREGRVEPSVDTVYTGRYRIGGGGWQTIPEPVTVAGAAVSLTVVEATPQLVG